MGAVEVDGGCEMNKVTMIYLACFAATLAMALLGNATAFAVFWSAGAIILAIRLTILEVAKMFTDAAGRALERKQND